MRTYTPVTAAYFANRSAMHLHLLLWVSARNRTNGAIETIGFWTGVDHQDFVIGGQTRTYYGAGAMLNADPLKWGAGLKTRTQRITLSQIPPEVQQMIRGYDPRHAPVELHRAAFDPVSRNLIDTPHLLLRGYIDKIDLSTPAKGGSGDVTISIASAARALTKPLNRYRSHASRVAAVPGDTFRKWATTPDKLKISWGSGKTKAGQDTPPPVNPFPGGSNK